MKSSAWVWVRLSGTLLAVAAVVPAVEFVLGPSGSCEDELNNREQVIVLFAGFPVVLYLAFKVFVRGSAPLFPDSKRRRDVGGLVAFGAATAASVAGFIVWVGYTACVD